MKAFALYRKDWLSMIMFSVIIEVCPRYGKTRHNIEMFVVSAERLVNNMQMFYLVNRETFACNMKTLSFTVYINTH